MSTVDDLDAAIDAIRAGYRTGSDYRSMYQFIGLRLIAGLSTPAEDEEYIPDPVPLVIPTPVEEPIVAPVENPDRELVPA